MAKKVTIETVNTQIGADGEVKPKAPIFVFFNDGEVPVKINGVFFNPREYYGVNAEPIIAKVLAENTPVENNTKYFINFFLPVSSGRRSLQLIEQMVKIVEA